jgi:hypothetical protein
MVKPRSSESKTAAAIDSPHSAPTATQLGADSPKTPVRTDPLAETQRGAWYDGLDMITALKEYDGVLEWDLPRDVQRIMVGASRSRASSSSDIALPGRGLSATHCLLERRGDRLRLLDQSSTNGVYFQDRRVTDVSIAPGATFTLAPVTFLAMNDEMRECRPTITDVIGTGFAPSPDKLLVEAATGSSNLLITGEPDCDQDRLARAIHAVSLRRRRMLIELTDIPEERAKQRSIINCAARSTLLLPITAAQRPLDPTFCAMLCSPSFHVRVIVLAPTIEIARDALTRDAVDQMQHVWVRPLALRSDEIDRLLDRLFVERGATLRAADLSGDNLAALRAYDWPDNLVSLRLIADAIVAHTTHQGLRPAAKSLGMPKSTLQKHLDRAGLSFPLLAR